MTAFTIEENSTINQTSMNIDTEGLRSYDILCGRCKNSFNHVGTRRFRVTIDLNLQRYLDARSRPEKGALIVSIVRMLRNCGARFLKKTDEGFVELNEKQAREKVGHALRDMAVAKQQSTMKERTQQQTKQRTEAKSQSVYAKQVIKVIDDGNDNEKFFESIGSLFSMCKNHDDFSLEPLPAFCLALD
jgi:hypothetical protein